VSAQTNSIAKRGSGGPNGSALDAEKLPNLFYVPPGSGDKTPIAIMDGMLSGGRQHAEALRDTGDPVLVAHAERIITLTDAVMFHRDLLGRLMDASEVARILSCAIRLGSEVTAALSVQLHGRPVLKQRKATAQRQQASKKGAEKRKEIGKRTAERVAAGERPVSKRHQRRILRGK
jgi:hypothetical protein